MADPIRSIKRAETSEEVIHEKELADVLTAVTENKEAILKGITLLSTVNEAGGLDTVSALIKHREVAIEKFIEEINKDRYAASIENLSDLFLLIGSIEVDKLQYFINKLNRGMKDAKEVEADESTSYMDVLKVLKDPEINRSITMLLELLRGMGKE